MRPINEEPEVGSTPIDGGEVFNDTPPPPAAYPVVNQQKSFLTPARIGFVAIVILIVIAAALLS